ncbi:MAG TPA: 50S ribosomal protein L15 [Bellilinea sp.]|nr:50S ribosomal protein L15 [Bellilinea sp.]
MKLVDLVPNVGSRKDRKRLGRGHAAGQGKTSGRGIKGQGSRSGEHGHLYRQGGNLPFYRRLPFIRGEGFTPPNQVEYNEVNVAQLAAKFTGSVDVTPEAMDDAGLIFRMKNPVVVLGNGDIKIALKVKAHRFTKSAKEKIEAAGGSVEVISLDKPKN